MQLRIFGAVLGAITISTAAEAQTTYVSISGGGAFLSDSENDGEFVGDFTTGEGTTIPGGTVLPDGTSVGWNSDFDTGWTLNGAVGRDYGSFRGEIELAFQSNGVDSHSGVSAAGIALDGEDAAVLVTGSPNLGVSVGDLVAAGQGDVRTIFAMANAFYDFDTGSQFTPYVGVGAGVGFVSVEYEPSAVAIINDNAVAFAYQAMAGVAYEVSPMMSIFAGYRYRATLDPEVEATLFSAEFDIENRASIIEAGVRWTF